MSGISRFLSSIELDNDLDNLSSQGISKIKNICDDFINEGGGGGPFIPLDQKAAPNGVCELNINGKVPVNRIDTIPTELTDLEDLKDVTINAVNYSDLLFYDNIGHNPPQWVNKSVTTDYVNEGLDPHKRYFTSQRVYDYLAGLMDPYDILFNNNGNIEGLPKGLSDTYLKSFPNGIGFQTIKLNEILDHNSQVRRQFTIPGNGGSVNMLQWIMTESGIFDNMIVPNQDLNPFFWGARDDVDYGQWKILNTSPNDVIIERVNIDMAANFIIFNFVNTLIRNIMDDNLNDGTVRIRPLGINHDQQAGDAQIINTTVNDLGRFRTITGGNYITVTQDDNTITITGDLSTFNLNDLNDVVINNPVNLEYLKYINGEWKNERSYISDNIDVSISSPNDKDVLIYQNAKFENRALEISDITNLQTQLNNKVNTTEYTNTGDLTFADAPNSVANLSIGTPGKILKVSAQSLPEWGDTITNLESLTDVEITNIQNNQGLIYNSTTTNWENKTLDTSFVAENINLYYTDAKVNTRLKAILTGTNDILTTNAAGNVARLAPGTDGQFLSMLALPTLRHAWRTITISNISNLQTTLDSKINSNILTTEGDIIYRNDTTTTRLPKGTNGQFLKSDGTTILWDTIPTQNLNLNQLTDVDITGLNDEDLLIYNQATNEWVNAPFSLYNSKIDNHILNDILTTNNSFLIRSANTLTQLTIGANNTYIKSDGTNISWATIPAGYTDADVETYIKSILTANDDILIRSGANLGKISLGADGTYLKSVNGNLEYGNVTLNLKNLSDANITNENLAGWLYWNSTTTEWEKHVISIGNVTDLQSELNGKLSNDLFDIQGQANGEVLLYSGVAGKFQNATLGIDNISQLESELLGKIPASSFTSKAGLLVGKGSDVYEEQQAPTQINQVLVSDITNVLNDTGVTWRYLNQDDLGDTIILNPSNGNVMAYNGTNWVNSTALTTLTAQNAINTAAIQTLEQNIYLQTFNPAVTPQTITFNQTNQPILRASYVADSALIPLDEFLASGLNNPNFIMMSPYGQQFGNFVGLTTQSQVASRLMLNGPNFSANVFNDIDRINMVNEKTVNWNYSNNPVAPGTYTCYCASGGANSPLGARWYGLKNANLVAANLTVYTEPTVGADWDLIYTTNVAWFNGGVGIRANVVINTTYFLVRFYTTDLTSRRLGSIGFGSNQTVNENYTFNNQVSLSNSTGDLVITKNTALQNSEQWTLSPALLVQYFTQNVINKVIRAVGQINLNSTIFEDYRIRINNIFNSFSYQNSGATQTYLQIDTNSNRVKLNNRFVSDIQKLEDSPILGTTINAINTYVNLHFGDSTPLTITNNVNSSRFLNSLANTDEFQINNALGIKLKINISISLRVDKNVQLFDITLWNMSDNVELQAFHRRCSGIQDNYINYNAESYFTPTLNTQRLSIKLRVNQNAAVVCNLTNMSILITDVML
jgi:hypothetical protein